MSDDGNMLKRILEAENAGRELVREAQEKADGRIHDVLVRLQEDFRAAREERLKRIFEESQARSAELQKLQNEGLAEFETNLRRQSIAFDEAARTVRKILALDGGRERA
jgi:hypothetical protein